MLFGEHLVVIRGGGDLGTGVAYRLHRAGFPVVVAELAEPLTIRRTVALSSAVREGEVSVEGLVGRRVAGWADAATLAATGVVPVLVDERLSPIPRSVVVDARLSKRNIDTLITDAPLVVGLGPGFTAAFDCHAVVETARGHHLGRVLWHGAAAPDSGVPGLIAGRGAERVVRSPAQGHVRWRATIGDLVTAGDVLGDVAGQPIRAGLSGVVRGLIDPAVLTWPKLKIADIDPRGETPIVEISDKALAVGGGVVEAVLTWISATR